MAIKSSYPLISEQVLALNKNTVEIMSKWSAMSTTEEKSIPVTLIDENGITTTFSMPSLTYFQSEITRLSNSIQSLYNIESGGALIQTSTTNKFKKIITVDLNREPNPVNDLGIMTQFRSQKNWFFDSMLNPALFIEINLDGKIENNVRKCLSRRYIVDFSTDANGNITSLGQSALNSFNQLYRGKNQVDIEEFENWYRTTPGIVEPFNPKYDEQIFDLEPNSVLYDGMYNVIKMEEDSLNRKLWYHLNTLNYLVNETGELGQLSVGDELIVNQEISTTRYKISEISNSESNPRVTLERIEGMQPIAIGIGTLKIYSPVVYRKKLRISIGYGERNILFLKPMNADTNLISKNWSKGTGYFTNDLRLLSNDNENGSSMDQYYTNFVYDYGEVLEDLVAKKIPNKLAGTPNLPILDASTFKVVQINKHLTDTADANLLKNKHNESTALKSEISQIQEALNERNKKLKVTKFSSTAGKKQFELEIEDLSNKKVSKSKLLASTTQEIVDLSKSKTIFSDPKYRLRGFWNMPEPVLTKGTFPQEIVQFRIQFRYLSKDGKETPVETFKISTEPNQNGRSQTKTAAFSNWQEFKTDARKRVFNKSTNEYTWEIEDIENADTPNINQLDLPISSDERIELRIKSISEVGWPDSPVESDWSEILNIEFPDDLKNVLGDNQFILAEATKEDLKVRIDSELTAKGLDEHLSGTITVNNKTFHHSADKINSGFKDVNSATLDLFEYLKTLENRIRSLEETIKKAKGELEITIMRGNQEFVISNNSEQEFNVECEDFLEKFTGVGIPTGRVYANNIYIIKDFVLKVKNKSIESPLGLLSNRSYLSNSSIYNTAAPQVFWVNNQDELLYSDVSGVSRTQLDNQFIWSVNYDTITQTNLSKVSENIGNNFTALDNNSLTNILSLSEYNLGFSENSSIAFVSGNNSLLDTSKWIDPTTSVGSTTKLLSSIHPSVTDLQKNVETNEDKIKTVEGGESNAIIIPIYIYFKMNAMDNSKNGVNSEYVNLNNVTETVKHIKKLKFLLDDENQNRPFVFTLKFTLNRAKVTFASKPKNYTSVTR